MPYYTALISAWNNATQPPPGVIGTALTGLTTAQKVAAVNAWKVAAPKPCLLTPSQIINACVFADLAALTQLQLTQFATLLSGAIVDASPNTPIRLGIQALFSGKTTTLQNLAALVAPFDNATADWCFSNGYPTLGSAGPGNISLSDAANAGLV